MYICLIYFWICVDQHYTCGNKHCSWSNYIQNTDWGYYSNSNNDCEWCKSKCDYDANCIGVECGGSVNYCSWWSRGKCETDSERTLDTTNYLSCFKNAKNAGKAILVR